MWRRTKAKAWWAHPLSHCKICMIWGRYSKINWYSKNSHVENTEHKHITWGSFNDLCGTEEENRLVMVVLPISLNGSCWNVSLVVQAWGPQFCSTLTLLILTKLRSSLVFYWTLYFPLSIFPQCSKLWIFKLSLVWSLFIPKCKNKRIMDKWYII